MTTNLLLICVFNIRHMSLIFILRWMTLCQILLRAIMHVWRYAGRYVRKCMIVCMYVPMLVYNCALALLCLCMCVYVTCRLYACINMILCITCECTDVHFCMCKPTLYLVSYCDIIFRQVILDILFLASFVSTI